VGDVTDPHSISVVLADDNLLVREGVRALLNADPSIEVVGVASDRDELIAVAGEHTPQVVVTDIRMPPSQTDEGIRAADAIRVAHPEIGVVVLSQYVEPEYARRLFENGPGDEFVVVGSLTDDIEIILEFEQRLDSSAASSPSRGSHRTCWRGRARWLPG